MANNNRKNQNKSSRDDFGGNQKVNRDLDDKDRGKMGEQEGMDRQQQSGGGQQQSQEPSKGELGTEIDDKEDDLDDEDVEEEDRITQRNPAQRSDRDSSK